MSIERAEIRNRIVSLLKHKKTDAKDRVYGSRANNVWQENLPAILIYPKNEEVVVIAESPRELLRTVFFSIELIADGKDDDDAADNLDKLGEQVERIMGVDVTLGGLASDLNLESLDFDFQDAGEKPIMSLNIVYRVEYVVSMPKDRRDQDCDDFTSITANWDIGTANDPNPEATDDITLP